MIPGCWTLLFLFWALLVWLLDLGLHRNGTAFGGVLVRASRALFPSFGMEGYLHSLQGAF